MSTSIGLLDHENIVVAFGISVLCRLEAEIGILYGFGHYWPPSWISDFRFGRTALELSRLSCWTPKMWGLPLKSRFYLVYKLRYKYFRFIGRHLGFPTSGLVGQYFQWVRWIAGPRNCGVCR